MTTPSAPSSETESTASQLAEPLSPTIKALGAVSLLTDISSEMVYPINPAFLTRALGAPAWAVGLIEGTAEMLASVLKLYSGRLSDRMGRRKPLTLVGYSLGAISKPLIGLSTVWPMMFFARALDRTGKGIRTAPRDALITENSLPSQRGRAFGLHRSLDTTGAVLGPLIGYVFLRFFPDALRQLYFLAFIPGMLSVFALWFFVRESGEDPAAKGNEKGLKSGASAPLPAFSFRNLSPEYRRYLGVVALFGLGNSSDAFLLLRAGDRGMTAANLLLLYAAFNVVEAALGYFAGGLSDRVGRRPLIATGYIIFAAVYLGFAALPSAGAVWPLFLLYGLYYTLTQGTQRAYAADLANPERRGAEIGAFHMVVGVSALPASIIAGWIYARVSPSLPFYISATTALCAAILLIVLRPRPLVNDTTT